MNNKMKSIKKKLIKNLIYLILSCIFLGFVIFITVWEETKGASLGWYYFLAVFFVLISAIRTLLAYYEKKIIDNPSLTMRR